jgi:Tfp pilus assembly protein PilX
MSQKTIILTVILFALIVLGMFTFARLRSAELQATFLEFKVTIFDRVLV